MEGRSDGDGGGGGGGDCGDGIVSYIVCSEHAGI